MESGNLSVNSNSSVRYSTPFGGFKRSGLGRELGPDALDSFTEVKNVFFADDWSAESRSSRERGRVQRFADRVAVITGGAGGIGRATAERLASEGATVVVVDLDADAGKALADELGGLFVAADVTSPEDNERIYAQTHEAYGRIDVAFHNAGISPPDDDSILDTGLDAWRRVQDVNLTSVYLGCKAVLPYMLAQGNGLDRQHGVVRRDDGRRDLADLLHGEQGRGAGDDARARACSSPGRACG